ncbi:RNA polymerase sigma factor [Streptosporangium lutulentum]|uniref:RNA polymerase sigma-70 factor (ECF subfamily) n=1 Tax=Streptosporangium lutulentum TaxID=1461250 RepID=A0ABT9QL92_9ACTN|nr:RNA polymerase sigma factor [Streptosporangium lutulentum]MDP9847038.1 RNA polymerase sigma-70 factor (ECF subfamily) [Streptosporangium lutulentum]
MSAPPQGSAPPIEVTDAHLIEQSWRQPERFGALFDRYFDILHRYVHMRLGESAADDIAAETFLRAFRSRQRYDVGRPSARAWLYGIASNLVADHRRNEARRYRALARSAELPDVASHDDRVVQRVSAATMQPQLASGLARLSAGDRDVLMLVACAQLSYEEVADALGIPRGTVGSRLNRARKKLRKVIGPYEEAL